MRIPFFPGPTHILVDANVFPRSWENNNSECNQFRQLSDVLENPKFHRSITIKTYANLERSSTLPRDVWNEIDRLFEPVSLDQWRKRGHIIITRNPAQFKKSRRLKILTPEAFLDRYNFPADVQNTQILESSERRHPPSGSRNSSIVLISLVYLLYLLRHQLAEDQAPGLQIVTPIAKQSPNLPPPLPDQESSPNGPADATVGLQSLRNLLASLEQRERSLSSQPDSRHSGPTTTPSPTPVPQSPTVPTGGGESRSGDGLVRYPTDPSSLPDNSSSEGQTLFQNENIFQPDNRVVNITRQELTDDTSRLLFLGTDIAINPQLIVNQQVENNTSIEVPIQVPPGNDDGIQPPTQPDPSYQSGIYTVGVTGQVQVNYSFDGGSYQGELGLFSLAGLEATQFGSAAFNQEVIRRVLSNSSLGYVAISDLTEAAQFSGEIPWEGEFNRGTYVGVKTFSMIPGAQFGLVLLPNGTFQQLANNLLNGINQQPLLFSLVISGLNEPPATSQIVDVTGQGRIFAMEDVALADQSDRDYNDIIFQIEGATGIIPGLDELINPQRDWRQTTVGQTIIRGSQSASLFPLNTSSSTQLGDVPLASGSTLLTQNLLNNPFSESSDRYLTTPSTSNFFGFSSSPQTLIT